MPHAQDEDRSLTIRAAGSHDLPAVRALLVETWHDTYDALFGPDKVTAITDEWHAISSLARGLARPDHVFLVAEVCGEIAGTASATHRGEGLVWLDRLYVRPKAQRAGMGKALLASVEHAFPQANEIRLEVERGNAKGLAFYERVGFVSAGQETTCHEVGRAAVLRRPVRR